LYEIEINAPDAPDAPPLPLPLPIPPSDEMLSVDLKTRAKYPFYKELAPKGSRGAKTAKVNHSMITTHDAMKKLLSSLHHVLPEHLYDTIPRVSH